MAIREFTLKRVVLGSFGTFGVLIDGKTQFCLSVEPPWKDNIPFVSCIPAGRYLCKRIKSPQFGDTFLIDAVPNRSHCVFHWGNYGVPHARAGLIVKASTEGCVVLGEEFGDLDGIPALLSSKRGFREFLRRTEGINEFYLSIIEC